MRSRRSVQPKMGIPSVGDIFDLSTLNSSPTFYEVFEVSQSPSEILVTFRLYENETNNNTWQMSIDSQGNKKILDISGNYIISDFRKSPQRLDSFIQPLISSENDLKQNIDPFQNLPKDMLTEILGSLDAKSLKNFCQTSKKIRTFCHELNDDFWRRRLDKDFPDRIQYGSSKLGFRKYYYWLLDASEGNIKPHPDRKKTPIFEFKEGQIINFPPNQYQIIEFDRFGYYPDYVLRVLDLRDQTEKFLIIAGGFFVGFNVILNDIDPSKLMTYDDIDPSNHMTYDEFAKNNTDVVPLLEYGFIAYKETPSNNDGPIRFKFRHPIIGKGQTGFVLSNGEVFSTGDSTSENLYKEQFRILKTVGYDLYRSYPEEFGYYQKQKNMK